jgi:hypothetical protein
VWAASIRFLRIDRGLKITERDQEAGYLLFEYKDDGKVFQGALELTPTEDAERRKATRIALKIDGRPSYIEDTLLEKLEEKLREDLGDPAPPPPPPPADAGVPDAGDDDSGGKKKSKKK